MWKRAPIVIVRVPPLSLCCRRRRGPRSCSLRTRCTVPKTPCRSKPATLYRWVTKSSFIPFERYHKSPVAITCNLQVQLLHLAGFTARLPIERPRSYIYESRDVFTISCWFTIFNSFFFVSPTLLHQYTNTRKCRSGTWNIYSSLLLCVNNNLKGRNYLSFIAIIHTNHLTDRRNDGLKDFCLTDIFRKILFLFIASHKNLIWKINGLL